MIADIALFLIRFNMASSARKTLRNALVLPALMCLYLLTGLALFMMVFKIVIIASVCVIVPVTCGIYWLDKNNKLKLNRTTKLQEAEEQVEKQNPLVSGFSWMCTLAMLATLVLFGNYIIAFLYLVGISCCLYMYVVAKRLRASDDAESTSAE